VACRTIIAIATPALGTGSTATIRKKDGGALASSPSGRGSFQFLHRVQWVNTCPVSSTLTRLQDLTFGPRPWNSLPTTLRRSDSELTEFK